jgi:hypothetical protein
MVIFLYNNKSRNMVQIRLRAVGEGLGLSALQVERHRAILAATVALAEPRGWVAS